MKPLEAAEERRAQFLKRLKEIKILDPACGSGNFLYLALQGVKDIEHRVNLESERMGLKPQLPFIGPEILKGIEINPVAAELARTTIWIGDIQWRIRNGIHSDKRPVLEKLDTIVCRDALITRVNAQASPSAESHVEAKWPEAEFIIGNPPFLGGNSMRGGLGDQYFSVLTNLYEGRVPGGADLVTYWFEKARAIIEQHATTTVGLVATQSIRRGSSRTVLDRIKETTEIFEAWSDEEWTIDGADVRISIVCFGHDSQSKKLDGATVPVINSDLSASNIDPTSARRLRDNLDVAFQGPVKVGPFDISGELARQWLSEPLNPNGKRNNAVLWPWINGSDVVRRPSGKWIIDFGEMELSEAQLFQSPFEFARTHILPFRKLTVARVVGTFGGYMVKQFLA